MTFLLLQIITLIWLVALVIAAPRAWEAWAWFALALVVRVLVAPPHVLMSWGYPYQVYLTYMGLLDPSPLYGSGWAAWMSLPRSIVGASPDRVNQLHVVLSALVPALLWATIERATADRTAARFGALVSTLLPLPIAVGATETPLILCAALLATALLGLVRADRVGLTLATSSAALLSHVRTDQGGVVLLLVAALLVARAWGLAAAAAVVAALRVAELMASSAIPLPVHELNGIPTVLEYAYGRGSSTTFLDPWVTPFWLVPLALTGLWAAWRTPGLRALGAICALTLIAGTLPYVGLHRVTDLARFHLPPQVPACLLAALAWPVIDKGGWASRAALAPGLVAGLWIARQPLGGALVHDVEDARLRAILPTLPTDATVRYDASRDQHGALRTYVAHRFGVTMTPWSDQAPLAPGELVWRGVGDRWDTPRPTQRCATTSLDLIETPAWDGGLIYLGPGAVRVGLERVDSCP